MSKDKKEQFKAAKDKLKRTKEVFNPPVDGVSSVDNQLNDDYQESALKDSEHVSNNIEIYSYNNKSR